MPYATNAELPPSVRHALPEHAQSIYRAAFNHAWQQHPGDEAAVHRIAWGAVKRQYRKTEGGWVPRDEAG